MKKAIHHICIQTNHYERSKQFYLNLGFELYKETPGFHTRSYNSWLRLGDFYIELQTAKKGSSLQPFNKESESIVHFCLYVENLNEEVARMEALNIPFQLKNGQSVYFVESGYLAKIIAPEGTIIELRDNPIL